MKRNYYILTVCLALLMGVFGCKPKEIVNPPNNNNMQEYVEVSINGAAPIRYVDKSNANTMARGFRNETILLSPSFIQRSLGVFGQYIPTPPITVGEHNINIGIYPEINKTYSAISYPDNNETMIFASFTESNQVGNDMIRTRYFGIGDSAHIANFLKIEEITWDSLGFIKGSFYFENATKETSVNNADYQEVSNNNKLQGTFRVKFSN